MAVKTIYTCDRCGHEQDTIEQMWTIRIVVSHGNSHPSTAVAGRNLVLWCRKCCDVHQLINEPNPTPTVPAPKILTFEDRLKALVEEFKEDVTEEVLSNIRP